jgi:hypothetical protein
MSLGLGRIPWINDLSNGIWRNGTIEKNTETLIDASKEVGLEINIEKTKYCCYLVTRMQVKIGT